MDFFEFLKNESESFGIKILVLFAIAGVVNALIIGVIIVSLGSAPTHNTRNFLLFIVCIVAYIRIRKQAMDRNSCIVEDVIRNIRIRILEKIRKTNLLAFEQIERSRYYTSLSQDSMIVSEAAKAVSTLCSSAILLVIASIYIVHLSSQSFLIMTGLIALAVLFYRQNSSMLEKELMEASIKENQFFEKVNHLMDGFSELKINEEKCHDFFDHFLKIIADQYRELKIQATARLTNINIFAQSFFYALMGFMIFILPILVSIDHSTLIQIVTVVLFIATGPLYDVVGTLPFVERANVAIKNLRKMEAELEQISNEKSVERVSIFKNKPFQSLQCIDIQFAYQDKEGQTLFQVGPSHFEISRGEIVFLMGGNGSGKSTFLKLLSGLYYTTQGTLLCNGMEITHKNMGDYRSYLSIIMQDFHLFDRLYGVKNIDFDAVNDMLIRMQLHEKTSVLEDGSFENTDLSTGQKKRMALITVELENRELCIFDEWAADQDPKFRQYFYEIYLKNLKERGKTVIAVTHDEKYYHVADRIYKMEYGKMTEVTADIRKTL